MNIKFSYKIIIVFSGISISFCLFETQNSCMCIEYNVVEFTPPNLKPLIVWIENCNTYYKTSVCLLNFL